MRHRLDDRDTGSNSCLDDRAQQPDYLIRPADSYVRCVSHASSYNIRGGYELPAGKLSDTPVPPAKLPAN